MIASDDDTFVWFHATDNEIRRCYERPRGEHVDCLVERFGLEQDLACQYGQRRDLLLEQLHQREQQIHPPVALIAFVDTKRELFVLVTAQNANEAGDVSAAVHDRAVLTKLGHEGQIREVSREVVVQIAAVNDLTIRLGRNNTRAKS